MPNITRDHYGNDEIRYEIHDIMAEVRLPELNSDELRALLELMTAVRQRVRASKVLPLRLVHSTGQTR
jgi:hypothetical protein